MYLELSCKGYTVYSHVFTSITFGIINVTNPLRRQTVSNVLNPEVVPIILGGLKRYLKALQDMETLSSCHQIDVLCVGDSRRICL